MIEIRENQILNVEGFFKAIYDESPIGIELYDDDGKLIDVNQSCLDLFGVSSIEEVKGFDLFNDPNVPKEYFSKLKQRERVQFETIFDFDLVKESKLYNTNNVGKIYIKVVITPLFLKKNNSISNYLIHVQDISEQKNSEYKLKNLNEELEKKIQEKNLLLIESGKYYQLITENLNDIITVVDEQGNAEYINEKANYEIMGYTSNDLLHKNVFNLVHPEDKEKIIRGFRNTIKNGEGLIESRILHKDGYYIWTETNGRTFLDSNGKMKILTISRNIMERKKIEASAKYEKEKADTYINLAGVILVALDREGIVTLMNKKGCEILGYEEGELEGQNWFDICLPEKIKDDVFKLFSGLMNGDLNSYEYSEGDVITKNGKNRTIAWHNTILYDKSNRIIGTISSGQDITDRKKDQIKLQQSEAELAAIYDYTPLAILLLDSERRIRKINKFALKITDRKEEEVFGIHGGEALRCLYSIKDPRGCGFSKECKTCIIRRTVLDTFNTKNPHINVEATLNLLPNSETDKVNLLFSTVPLNLDGEDRILVSMVDITERIEVEQKLKESEEKYRTLINNIPGMVYRGRPDWSVEFLSNSQLISGYQEDDFLSQKLNWVDIVHPDDKELILSESSTLEEKPTSISQSYRIIHKNRSTKWVNDYKISFFNKNEEFCGVDGIVYDITAQKISEEKLVDSEEKFRTIAEQTALGILIQQQDQIIFVNNAVSEILEYPLEEINNWTVEDLVKVIKEEDLQIVKENSQEREEGDYEKVINYECRIITKTGRLKWVEVRSKAIKYLGKYSILVSLIDITSRKKVEEDLKEISRVKSELLSRTSHELKTPLVSIKGYADLLLSQHYEMMDIYTISVLNEIKQGCYRLESLIKDLLDTSKLEAEEIQLNKSEEDLSFLIKFCVRELRGLLEKRRHKLNLNIQNNMLTIMEKERIYEVIMNILSNAIKYTPPNGNITIKSEIIDNKYIISIKDNGIGITSNEKLRIFKKFGKIERYGKGLDVVSEGTGLGLYISRRIIELHGGKIWVESKGREKGSTFYFSMPIIKE
jgi:PAS domain S-box-containing protein